MNAAASSRAWPRLFALSAVYLVWGAIASLNDLLIPYLKDEFELDFAAAMHIQFVFYMAYFLLSIPCGMLARRFGFRNGLLAGLGTAFLGCLFMIGASRTGSYTVVLGAVFVLASGITMLQVSANPFATSLGPRRTSASRLTVVQSFHSLGTTIGPWLGAVLIFSVAVTWNHQQPGQAIWLPYAMLAAALALLAAVFLWMKQDVPASSDAPLSLKLAPLFRANRLLLPGTVGIFCYVGAEIAIASLLVNYLVRPEITGLDYAAAGKLVSVYWGFALVGRFAGIGLLRLFPPNRMLAVYAAAASGLLVLTITGTGSVAAAAILLVGFFNSIMFPTIFASTLDRSPAPHTPSASGVLCMGIVGGAVVSQAQGAAADSWGIQASFAVPLLCYLYIGCFAIYFLRPAARGAD